MEIVKIESLAEVTTCGVYYNLNGKFYAACEQCGKPVELDYHLTASDLRNEDPGERDCYCGEYCERKWFLNEYTTFDEALICGDEKRACELFTYSLKKTTVTVCRENANVSHVAMTPQWSVNINDLKRYALDHLIPNTFDEDDDFDAIMMVDDAPELTVTDTAIEMVFNVDYQDIESIKITFELNK